MTTTNLNTWIFAAVAMLFTACDVGYEDEFGDEDVGPVQRDAQGVWFDLEEEVGPGAARAAYSANGNWIAFDKIGADGYYDVWTRLASGGQAYCITCDIPAFAKGVGNPSWHPGGYHIAVIATDVNANFSYASNPGMGKHNDLYIITLNFWKTAAVNSKRVVERPTENGCVVHPRFNPAGNWLSWTQCNWGYFSAERVGDPRSGRT